MSPDPACPLCRRAISGPDEGCSRCGRPALPSAVVDRARARSAEFAARHARDPWLRSGQLLSYSLRSRRRGFLDDAARPFARAALELLHFLSRDAGAAGISPLAETVIQEELEPVDPALARAVTQLLELHRDALARPGTDFAEWLEEISA